MVLTIDPTKMLFSRQQVAAATGLAEDILAYWIKEDLLPARGGGEGRGRPRQFGYEAIHRAAVYGELRHYGVGIMGMRELGAIIDEAVQLKEQLAGYGSDDVLDAQTIFHARNFYGSATADQIAQSGYGYPDFETWLAEWEGPPFSAKALELSERYHPKMGRAWSIVDEIFGEQVFRCGSALRWLITLDDDGNLELWPEAAHNDGAPSFPAASYITLNIGLILRRLWDLPCP